MLKSPTVYYFAPNRREFPKIIICDGENDGCVKLESKDYMEYLGGIIEKNLSRKFHIDATPTKISKTVGLITKLCNFSPRRTSLYSNLT